MLMFSYTCSHSPVCFLNSKHGRLVRFRQQNLGHQRFVCELIFEGDGETDTNGKIQLCFWSNKPDIAKTITTLDISCLSTFSHKTTKFARNQLYFSGKNEMFGARIRQCLDIPAITPDISEPLQIARSCFFERSQIVKSICRAQPIQGMYHRLNSSITSFRSSCLRHIR